MPISGFHKRDGQDPENQKYGLLEYANAKGFAPLHREEIASRAKDWRKRKLGAIIEKAERGDVLLTPEITRIAGFRPRRLGNSQSGERARPNRPCDQTEDHHGRQPTKRHHGNRAWLGCTDRHFIQARTTEALQVARERGKTLGRPKGSKSSALKLVIFQIILQLS